MITLLRPFSFCLTGLILILPLNALCQPKQLLAFSELAQAKSVPANTAPGSASAPGPPTLDRYGHLFISPPSRQLTIADLVGNWGDNPGRIATTYVYKSNGAYAGTDSL